MNKTRPLPQAIHSAIQLYQGTLVSSLDNQWYTLEFPSHKMMYYWVNAYDQWDCASYMSKQGQNMSEKAKVKVDTRWQ